MNKKVLVLIVLVLLAMGAGWYGVTTAQFHAINPLSEPVTVTLDGKPFVISANARAELGRVRGGEHTLVTTRADGKELERLTVQTESRGTNVYAVFGAAPLSIDTFWYHTENSAPNEPRHTSLCGKPAFQVHHVDYAFENPPSRIDMPKGSSSVQRTVLRLDEGGLNACLNTPTSEPEAIAELTLKVRAVLSKPEQQRSLTWWAAELFTRAGKKQRALELAEPMLDDPQATINDHRGLQDLMRSAGRHQDLAKRYRARAEREPSAQNAYLLARVLPAEQSIEIANEALEKWPEDPWLHRSRMWILDVLGDSAKSLGEAEWILKQPKDKEDEWPREFARDLKVRALVSLNRTEEALEFLKAELEPVKEWSLADAIEVARTARVAKQQPWVDPFSRIARKPGSDDDVLFKYFYELSLGGTNPSRPGMLAGGFAAFEVLEAARTNPEEALRRISSATETQQLFMSPEQSWVLLVEAWRMRNEAAAQRVIAHVRTSGDLDASRAYVNAESDDETPLRDALPEAQAALLLGRGRTLDARGDHEAATRVFARLRKTDPLGGLAVQASVAWRDKNAPAPEMRIREAGKVKLE